MARSRFANQALIDDTAGSCSTGSPPLFSKDRCAVNTGEPEARPREPLILEQGQRVQQFVVETFLSRGATAQVFRARDSSNGATVAIRVLDSGLTQHAVDQFQLEAIAYGLFDSRHLPKLHAVGRLTGGQPFMVLEYVRGFTLSERLDEGALSVPACVELGIQLMHALYDCHAQGFIHCDVKPQNIIVSDTDTPLVKLVDFGICQRIRQPKNRAVPSFTIGTPPYMSPEQIEARPLDLRTDIYSTGVVLYQAMTGRLPFDGRTAEEVMARALSSPIIPPRVLRDHCPLEFERVIMRMLCKNAKFRYPSARLVADELGWVASKHAIVRGRSAWGAYSSLIPPSAAGQLEPTRPLPTPRPLVIPKDTQ